MLGILTMHYGSEQDRQGPSLMVLSFLGVTPMASEGSPPGRASSLLQSQRPSSSAPSNIMPQPILGNEDLEAIWTRSRFASPGESKFVTVIS